jgi:hypothetical protein
MNTNSTLSSTNDDQQTSETDRTLVNMTQMTTSHHEQCPSTNDDQQTSETDPTLVNMTQITTSHHEQCPSTNDDLLPVSNDATSSVNNMIPSTSNMSGTNIIHSNVYLWMRPGIY